MSRLNGFFALKEFQHAADAAIAIIGVHAGHMRMQIRKRIANADDRERVAHQTIAVERAEDLAAGIGSDHKCSDGLDFEIRFLPDFALQRDAAVKFFQGPGTCARRCVVGHRVESAAIFGIGVFVFCGVADFRWPGCPAIYLFSPRFTESHSDSISSRGSSAKVRLPVGSGRVPFP